jgi:hypothetical protein
VVFTFLFKPSPHFFHKPSSLRSNIDIMSADILTMPASPTKMNRAQQEEWLDRQWGGKSWLIEEVRSVHERPPKQNELAGVAVDYLVKITRLAQDKGIELASLWSQAPPYNVLWTGVRLHSSSLRLTGEVARAALSNLKTIINSQNAQDAGGPSEIVIMESRETGPEACVHVTSDHAESDSSDNEDIEPVLKATPSPSIILGGSPKSPAKLSGNNDKHSSLFSTFKHQEPQEQKPAPQASRAPLTPGASSLPPQMNISGHFNSASPVTPVKRKREKYSSAVTPQRVMKRAENYMGEGRVSEATAIYEQLVNNVKLKDATLSFLTTATIAWYAPEQDKIKVLDPLWFKVDGTTTCHSIKLEKYNKLCFSIHHLKPKHWTLAVVDIDDEAKSMVFNHHDSTLCQDRFDAVCVSFQKWKETVAFEYKLGFNNVTVSHPPSHQELC